MDRALNTSEIMQEAFKFLQTGQLQISLERDTNVRLAEARDLEQRLLDVLEAIAGDPLPERHGHVGHPSILDRAQSALFGTLRQTHGPTATHREQAEIAKAEFAAIEPALRALLEIEVTELKAKANATGAPWTSGRRIP